MTNSICQKHPELGTREFKLVADTIEYRISNQFGDEELSVVLSVLAPEPIKDGDMLYFVSEVNREALIKLFADLPDQETFTRFVQQLQKRIREESFGNLAAANRETEITRVQVDTTIRMLKTYLNPVDIKHLLSALTRLSDTPNDREHLDEVMNAFNELGVQQGQVLTYAPFFNTLISSTDLDDLS